MDRKSGSITISVDVKKLVRAIARERVGNVRARLVIEPKKRAKRHLKHKKEPCCQWDI